jgi:hypothetical protein
MRALWRKSGPAQTRSAQFPVNVFSPATRATCKSPLKQGGATDKARAHSPRVRRIRRMKPTLETRRTQRARSNCWNPWVFSASSAPSAFKFRGRYPRKLKQGPRRFGVPRSCRSAMILMARPAVAPYPRTINQPAIGRHPEPTGGDDQSPHTSKDSSLDESASGQPNSAGHQWVERADPGALGFSGSQTSALRSGRSTVNCRRPAQGSGPKSAGGARCLVACS